MGYEIRADGSLHIEGYVNAVERDSRAVICPECGKCVEQIAAGAFGEALRAAKDVAMLVNHNRGRKIGSVAEGNLSLSEDSIGLRAYAVITDNEVIEKARRGLLRGWSFGFKARDTEIEKRGENLPRRRVKALDIFEVSIIDDRFSPCYAGTSIEMRAGGEELIETRFNPYHDPQTGRFTDAGGGGMGATLYVGKGEKGKGQYVVAKEINGTDNAEFQGRNAAFIKENNRLLHHYPTVGMKENELKEAMSELAYDVQENTPYLMKEKTGTVYKVNGTVFNYKGKLFGYGNVNGNDYLTDIQTSAFLPVKPPKYTSDTLHSIQKTADRLNYMASLNNRAEPAVNPEYAERCRKSEMDGYRIRAALLDVPP